jgi:hypothetical protein
MKHAFTIKRVWPSLAFALAAAALLLWLGPRKIERSRLMTSVRENEGEISAANASAAKESVADTYPDTDAETNDLNLAPDLNAPGKTIMDDLKALDGVFSVWQTNFLHTGNPVGTNAEITAELTGHNGLHTAFISPKNPAINRAGELCDRWGTPFFFHQLSGTKMEILSAGPDRKRGTADDVLLTP